MITPAWTAPNTVSALSTIRQGGVSVAPFDSFNVGLHVGDDEQAVLANRALLTNQLPNPAVWLNQTHSSDVIVIDEKSDLSQVRAADALYTRLVKQPLAIMTADCLPVLLCSSSGEEVAAVHGGWRGLAQAILANTVSHFQAPANDIIAWLGPAIGPSQFEVGQDVKDSFCLQNPVHQQAFTAKHEKYMADIYLLARQQLAQLGVVKIYGGEYCTVTDKSQFFSYRRDGQTGRMASLIWRN
ncbi:MULTISPECIES: peptidoglycan editing factor PgeF [unclassified Pseudoalteromonas]|uniref:peptidoglycan editing factor PgeF n=1 Tax=unclassified Pseudoalteromonas TaxID=194690 RepID=UPI00110A730B|nr:MULTISPECIES: peptidoglycan editing factor PgeF [unclassified Pseudoalteromonas]TMP47773.1 peptidoglycan editing factor PgeF [Pseudoalteromonas sp. S1650]TMP65443.1 peptidoglycan editing factor PgeF [Pseudoalteromonas sp. S1649]